MKKKTMVPIAPHLQIRFVHSRNRISYGQVSWRPAPKSCINSCSSNQLTSQYLIISNKLLEREWKLVPEIFGTMIIIISIWWIDTEFAWALTADKHPYILKEYIKSLNSLQWPKNKKSKQNKLIWSLHLSWWVKTLFYRCWVKLPASKEP